jgi:hypothetical protein
MMEETALRLEVITLLRQALVEGRSVRDLIMGKHIDPHAQLSLKTIDQNIIRAIDLLNELGRDGAEAKLAKLKRDLQSWADQYDSYADNTLIEVKAIVSIIQSIINTRF